MYNSRKCYYQLRVGFPIKIRLHRIASNCFWNVRNCTELCGIVRNCTELHRVYRVAITKLLQNCSNLEIVLQKNNTHVWFLMQRCNLYKKNSFTLNSAAILFSLYLSKASFASSKFLKSDVTNTVLCLFWSEHSISDLLNSLLSIKRPVKCSLIHDYI